jgi:Na+/phosphate symporter
MVCRGRAWNIGACNVHLAQAAREAPPDISAAAVLRCLAEHAGALGAHRLARAAHQRLQRLRLPPAEQVAAAQTNPSSSGTRLCARSF